MIKDCGATWAIIGHSERRQYFGETNEVRAWSCFNSDVMVNRDALVKCVDVPLVQSNACEELLQLKSPT